MNRGQDRDGLFSHVDSSEDHGRLGDPGQPGGQLLRRQVVELQVHMVLVRTHTSTESRAAVLSTASCLQPRSRKTVCVPPYLPSLISMVMERDTTSLEARSLALGA